jgi:hypothetical protein
LMIFCQSFGRLGILRPPYEGEVILPHSAFFRNPAPQMDWEA